MTSRRRTAALRPARRHIFEPHPTDAEMCAHCPAPEGNLAHHPPVTLYRDAAHRPLAAETARAQLADIDDKRLLIVVAEEAWLWLTREHGSIASVVSVLDILGHHRRAPEALVDAARRNLVAVGLLERSYGSALRYDAVDGGTARRYPNYTRTH